MQTRLITSGSNRSPGITKENDMRKSGRLLFPLLLMCGILIVLFSYGGLQNESTQEELFRFFRWRNIGPANMMGRISALDGLDEDYRVVLVGSASGGVFKSTNAGISL